MQRRACMGNYHMIFGNSLTSLTTRSSTYALSCAQLRACTFAHSASYSIVTLHPKNYYFREAAHTIHTQHHNQRTSPWRTSTHPVQALPYPATCNTPTTSCHLSLSCLTLQFTTCASSATSCSSSRTAIIRR